MSTKNTINNNISPCQQEYIKECIELYNSSTIKFLCYSSDNIAPDCIPKPQKSFWLKPVYFMDPAKQFNTKIICSDCKTTIADDGWNQNYRVIDCLSTDAFLVQKKYKCKCSNSNFTAYDLLASNRVPDYMKLYYPFQGK